MRRTIVTGGAGFVGNAVVRELLRHNVDVWVLVRPGFSEKLKGSRLDGLNVHLVECDLREISKLPSLIDCRGFDAWYQFAWEGLFGEDLLDYHQQIANVEWVLDAICVAKEVGCSKFIGSGSISQYELGVKDGQGNPGDKHRVYKTAKLACEHMGKSIANSVGIQFIWPIITNIYGVGERSPRLIKSMIRNLQAGKHQALSKGNQYYDFIYITDAAKAFHLVGESGKQGRTYIISSGQAQPLKNFLTILRDIVAPHAELGFGELSFNGVYLPLEAYSTDELCEDTGFSPDVSFAEGIRRTAEWISQVDRE